MEEQKECNCLKDTADLMLKQIHEDEKDTKGFKVTESNWENISWFPKVRMYANYIFKTTFEKKDGSTSRNKNYHMRIFFSYCPFCGQQLK